MIFQPFLLLILAVNEVDDEFPGFFTYFNSYRIDFKLCGSIVQTIFRSFSKLVPLKLILTFKVSVKFNVHFIQNSVYLTYKQRIVLYCNNYTKNIKLVFTGIICNQKNEKYIFISLRCPRLREIKSKTVINNNVFDGQKRFKNE